MKKFNFLALLSVKVLLAASFLLLSEIISSTHLQVGGARADIDVDIRGLVTTSPVKKRVDDLTLQLKLPKLYKKCTSQEKGKYAQRLARDIFLSLAPSNKYSSLFSIVSCNGTYEIAEDNGYDGFYVLLDNNNQVARFSDSQQIVKATTDGDPIIIINESKVYKDGRLRFGKGIKLNGEEYATQMSEAWVRIVAHNIVKKTPAGKCAITDGSSKEPNCRYAACKPVHEAILRHIVEGSCEDLQNVFRVATVLADDGTLSIYALGSDENTLDRTEALLRQLFKRHSRKK